MNRVNCSDYLMSSYVSALFVIVNDTLLPQLFKYCLYAFIAWFVYYCFTIFVVFISYYLMVSIYSTII